MRYNELTYHKANPFFKQGFLPDRAWYNRKPKEFPSEIPTGDQYFTDSGRKHYQNRFNYSEIEHQGVLTSPEKYPYQNRIALEKAYMRSLDTTDIEGAGSGTRVNEAVRNKLRAQEELARKYNQSLDLRQHKEHQYQEKRRQLAIKQFETVQTKKSRVNTNGDLNNSRVSNPELKNNQQNRYPQHAHQTIDHPKHQNYYSDPYIKLAARHNQPPPQQHFNSYQPQPQQQPPPPQPQPRSQPQPSQQSHRSQHPGSNQALPGGSAIGPESYVFNANDRHQSNPSYINHYDSELQRRREDYMKTIEMDNIARAKYADRRDFRKYNPTNLSFNLAGQNIVGGKQ